MQFSIKFAKHRGDDTVLRDGGIREMAPENVEMLWGRLPEIGETFCDYSTDTNEVFEYTRVS